LQINSNKMIGSSSESSCIQTVFISKYMTDHKLVEDVHEDSLQIPSQINRFLCNRPDEPLKASGCPAVSRSYIDIVRTTEQHCSDVRSIIILYWVGFQKSTLLGKSLQVVRTTWQHVRTLSSISEYSSVPFEHRKEL
jgi:hypothetical protein